MPLVSTVLFTFVGVVFLALGGLYVRDERLLPPHQSMLGRKWSDLDRREQFVLSNFERSIGFAILGASAVILIATHSPLEQHPVWAASVAAIAGLSIAVWVALSAIRARAVLGVQLPWSFAVLQCVLIAIGWLVAVLGGAG